MTFTDAGSDGEPPDAAAPDADLADAPTDAPTDATPTDAPVVLTSAVGFSPGLGSLCGAAYDHVTQRVWLHPCSGASVHAFTVGGTAAGTLARPGEAANDVDVAIAPAAIIVGTNAVAAGGMLFINGETSVAEVHLPDTASSTPLVTAFGASHVVGGGYHLGRSTLFLLQDNVPATSANTVAELDRVTGAVVNSFSIAPVFNVSYGDLEVCASSGNLFLVSSVETTIAELTPTGALVAEYPLPTSVSAVSGLGLGPDGQAWLVGTSGQVWRLDGLPCAAQ